MIKNSSVIPTSHKKSCKWHTCPLTHQQYILHYILQIEVDKSLFILMILVRILEESYDFIVLSLVLDTCLHFQVNKMSQAGENDVEDFVT